MTPPTIAEMREATLEASEGFTLNLRERVAIKAAAAQLERCERVIAMLRDVEGYADDRPLADAALAILEGRDKP